jgi:spermidine synthase
MTQMTNERPCAGSNRLQSRVEGVPPSNRGQSPPPTRSGDARDTTTVRPGGSLKAEGLRDGTTVDRPLGPTPLTRAFDEMNCESIPSCHPRESGGPGKPRREWIPASAGMTQTGCPRQVVVQIEARKMIRTALLVALCIALPLCAAQEGWPVLGQNEPPGIEFKVLLEKESLYHYICVVESDGVRRLQFRRSGSEYEESSINVRHPLRFEMNYYPLMFAAFAHRPDPKRILFLGLGGGTLSMAMRCYYPQVTIDNIELDPDVLAVARKYFGFVEDDRMKVYVRDGRVQVRRLLRDKVKYDIIFADAFRGGYIPYHLTTKEFMEDLKALLTPDGIVVSNLQPGFESYHYHRRTFNAVFRHQCSYGGDGNVVVVVDAREKPLTQEDLRATAHRLQQEKRFTFDLPSVIEERNATDYVREGPILTDDYAPTDILRGMPR